MSDWNAKLGEMEELRDKLDWGNAIMQNNKIG